MSISRLVSNNLAGRDIALDAWRGLLILAMVLVNHPPPDVAVYRPLAHAAWHGWTLADAIFPGFLLAVGISIRLAMLDTAGLPLQPAARPHAKVLRRFALLMLCNFLLINFPYYVLGTLYFTGTLALIAWCYLFAAFLNRYASRRVQVALVLAALLVQWGCYAFLPVPGHGAGVLTPDANAARYVDRALFVPLFGSAWSTFDETPVLLPMLGALATTLIGLLAGHWIRSPRAWGVRIGGLFAAGLVLVMLGMAWDAVLPINKKLWTGSYVALMAGIALSLLGALHWFARQRERQSWLAWLQVAGANSLFFYVFAQALQRVLVFGRIHVDDGAPVRLRYFLYERYVGTWLHGAAGSLCFTLSFLAVCYAVALLLYRRRIFVKL